VVEELTVSGGVTNLSKTYTHGLGLISQRLGSGTVSFFGSDGLGSTRFLSGTNGTITETYAYDAYGTLIASNTTPSTVYLFTGQQWDPDIGLYYLRARYYSPHLGRFWTMDSFEGTKEDPLSLRKYSYCVGDPANRIDPSGNESLVSLMGAIVPRIGIAAQHTIRLYMLKERIEFGLDVIQLLPEAQNIALELYSKGIDGLDDFSAETFNEFGSVLIGMALRKAGGKSMTALGNDLRDRVGAVFKRIGFEVAFEVHKYTPFGMRIIDVEIRLGKRKMGFETKHGTSRYRLDQKIKDEWLWTAQRYRVIVVRGTHDDLKD
jgi:RHS repeat-associated protein